MGKKNQFAMLSSKVRMFDGGWESLVRAPTEMDIIGPGTNILHVTIVCIILLFAVLMGKT